MFVKPEAMFYMITTSVDTNDLRKFWTFLSAKEEPEHAGIALGILNSKMSDADQRDFDATSFYEMETIPTLHFGITTFLGMLSQLSSGSQ